MKNLNLLYFIVILFSANCYSQITNENQLLLVKTARYIYTQQHTFNTIKATFPEQKSAVGIAESEFNKNFGTAIAMVDTETKNLLGDKYETFLTNLSQELDDNSKQKKITEKSANAFVLNSVQKQIESPVLETLLKYEYINNPVDEFLANHINIYTVRSYSNFEKFNFTIHIPKSWTELDGSDSSMLKKFRSEYNTGNQIITITKKSYNITENQLNTGILFSDKEMREMAPADSKIVSITNKKINSELASIIQYEQTNPTIGSNQKRYIIKYLLISQNNLVEITCTNYGAADDNLVLQFQKFYPLYESIVKSASPNDGSDNNLFSSTKNKL